MRLSFANNIFIYEGNFHMRQKYATLCGINDFKLGGLQHEKFILSDD